MTIETEIIINRLKMNNNTQLKYDATKQLMKQPLIIYEKL